MKAEGSTLPWIKPGISKMEKTPIKNVTAATANPTMTKMTAMSILLNIDISPTSSEMYFTAT